MVRLRMSSVAFAGRKRKVAEDRKEGIRPFPFQRAATLAADAVATDR